MKKCSICQSKRELGSYRIFTRDDYKKYRLSGMEAWNIRKDTIDFINETFDHISGGYNFIIAIGKCKLMFYSVEYFNKNILR